jgi:integrase
MGKKRLNSEGTFYFMESKKLWQYRIVLGYDDSGKPIRKAFYGKSPAEAKAKAEKTREQLDNQKVTISPDIRLGDWMKQYLEIYKKGAVQSNWYNQLVAFLDKIPPEMQRKKTGDIAPAELQKLINQLSQKYAQGYVHRIRILIKSAFTEAQENGIITKNPARKLTVPAKPEKPRQAYTKDEVAAIVSHAENYKSERFAVGAVILLFTGIRRGELLGLKWTDIDGDTLHIRRGVFMDGSTPTAEEYRAKTAHSIRDVPLPHIAKLMLDKIQPTGDYIISGTKGNILDPHNFNRGYYRFIDSVPGIRRLSPHCCRHTYATITLTAGANLRNVQSLLGHTDPKTTARYTHPMQTELQSDVQNMVNFIYPQR